MLIAALLPHAGAMVLLDGVLHWDDAAIRCVARTHLHPRNPLRRAGRLPAVCGVEYGLQAAALHGALRDGNRSQPAGFLARLRDVVLHAPFLDDPAFPTLLVDARLDRAEAGGLLCALHVGAEDGTPLLSATAAIAFPASPCAAP